MKHIITASLFALSACTSTTYRDRVQMVNVPVAQPCLTALPAPVAPLGERFSDTAWQSLDVRQKAAAMGAIAVESRTYGEQLEAASAGCKSEGN